jgi:hypothetical protein
LKSSENLRIRLILLPVLSIFYRFKKQSSCFRG